MWAYFFVQTVPVFWKIIVPLPLGSSQLPGHLHPEANYDSSRYQVLLAQPHSITSIPQSWMFGNTGVKTPNDMQNVVYIKFAGLLPASPQDISQQWHTSLSTTSSFCLTLILIMPTTMHGKFIEVSSFLHSVSSDVQPLPYRWIQLQQDGETLALIYIRGAQFL